MPAIDVAFAADLPQIILEAGDRKTSRVQIAKTGKFSDPRYGKFAITRDDFSAWIKNFNTLAKADDRLGLPVDVDHSPEKKGETEAAGWVTNLDSLGKDGKTSTPNELWATVEWNSLGVELIADRRYAYLSPSYQHNFADETGRRHGTALVGVGLTNRPFLTMATVSLSRGEVTFAVEEPDVSDSPEHMPEHLKKILAKLGLPEDADEATTLAAIDALEQTPPKPEDINLDSLAAASGKVLLSADDLRKLAADAEAGREAAKTLSTQRFEDTFAKAVDHGRTIPAMKETYAKLYATDPETTLSALDNAPVVLSTVPAGSAGGGEGGGGESHRNDAEGAEVDTDRADLHEKAVKLAADRNIDYSEAVLLAAQGA